MLQGIEGIRQFQKSLSVPRNTQAIEGFLELPRHVWEFQAFVAISGISGKQKTKTTKKQLMQCTKQMKVQPEFYFLMLPKGSLRLTVYARVFSSGKCNATQFRPLEKFLLKTQRQIDFNQCNCHLNLGCPTISSKQIGQFDFGIDFSLKKL